MSTIKSSSEHLTLNADGASKDIKFQANGVEKASIDSSGNLTVSGGVTTTGARSFFAPASENFGIGVKHVTGGGALYFGASSSSSTPDGGIYNSGGSQILGFGNDRNVTIPAGNLVIGTAGKGIDFSATSDSGGMTSEVLDDYEEGTWTPAITMGSGTATLTATTGRYTKIGRMVTASIDAHVASVSTPSGSCTVNLPFTTNSVVRECVVFHTYGHTIPTGESHTIAQTLDSQSNLNLLYGGGTTTPSFVPSAGTYFTLTLTYEAA